MELYIYIYGEYKKKTRQQTKWRMKHVLNTTKIELID